MLPWCGNILQQLTNLDACGVRKRNASGKYLEILYFRHSVRFTTFTKNGPDERNKELKDNIEVSVVLDMECGDVFP